MDIVTSLAVVIGVMGGIATWGVITLANPFVLIWSIFIGWGCFYHCGGKVAGLQAAIPANIWGTICAAAALVALTGIGVSAVTAGLCVGVSVVVMILGAKAPGLGAIPAAVYGYASTAGLFLHGGAAYGGDALGIVKVAGAIAASMVIGNILGFVSEKMAGGLVKP